MAKLTARGCHAVAKVKATNGSATFLFAVRSDRKVLRRFTGDLSTGYTIIGTLKEDRMVDPEGALRSMCDKRGLWVL